MTTSLYSVSVEPYIQCVAALKGVLIKGKDHCVDRKIDPDSLVQKRLIDDMLPLQFQIQSVWWHSIGAIKALESGVFTPPPKSNAHTYDDLIDQLVKALEELKALDRKTIDGYANKPVNFKLGESIIPFLSEGFVLSFSLPNIFFHATTAYDILRIEGVPLGKRDYLGKLTLA